jgi:phage gp29-like protein
VATAPLSATTSEIDTLYDHLTNLSQETALILPEGYSLEFINPQGSPETFSQLRDSLIKEINMLISGEDETGNAEAGSRASSEVAQNVRQIRAQELSELLCATLNETIVRWIVDLNFGSSVVSPTVRRNFVTEDKSSLTMNDVGTLIERVGYRPTKEWIEETFKVNLEEGESTLDQEQEKIEEITEEPDEEGEALTSEVEEEMAPAEETQTPETEEEDDDEEMNKLLDELFEPPDMSAEEDEDKELNKLLDELIEG